jgi:hypothetical protein
VDDLAVLLSLAALLGAAVAGTVALARGRGPRGGGASALGAGLSELEAVLQPQRASARETARAEEEHEERDEVGDERDPVGLVALGKGLPPDDARSGPPGA